MKLFTSLFLLFICLNLSSFSQAPVTERPVFPPQARQIQPCEKGAIWIKGEWKWDSAAGEYTWQDGHCEECPRNKTYVPGSWKRENGFWVWVPGTWKKIARSGFRKP